MALHPELGYFDEGLNLTDAEIYKSAQAPESQASILPPVAYRSRIFAELEDEKVWTRHWCCVGTIGQLHTIGDLLPYTLGNHGIHVQMEQAGFSARFNFAQHGGCRFVPAQCQTGKKTKCSYTSCGYSRDRDVVHISEADTDTPVFRHFVGDMPERMLPVSVDTFGQYIFVNVDQNGCSLDKQLANINFDLGKKSTEHGFEAGYWQPLLGNWKVILCKLFDIISMETNATPLTIDKKLESHIEDDVPNFVVATDSTKISQRMLIWVFPNLLIERNDSWESSVIIQPTGLDEVNARIRVRYLNSKLKYSEGERNRELDRWRKMLSKANKITQPIQKSYQDWGTPHSPNTSLEALPESPGGAGYIFQKYIIDRLLAEYDYVWNAPLYTDARR